METPWEEDFYEVIPLIGHFIKTYHFKLVIWLLKLQEIERDTNQNFLRNMFPSTDFEILIE